MSEEQTTERNAEREQLLAALDAADTSAGEEPVKAEELASADQANEESPTAPEPEAQTTQVETEASEQTGNDEADGDDQLSNREKKANKRLDRGWDKLNEEKASLQREREEFERAKQERADDKMSPEDLRELAERYKADGEDDLAELALEKANEVEQRKQARKQAEAAGDLQGQWEENLKDLQEQYPDLAKGNSELARGVENVLEQRPHLRGYPEGIQDAVEFVNSKMAAKQVEALQKEKGDLETRIAELEKQTSVAGSPPGKEVNPKEFNDMSQSQQREKLMDQLKAADEQMAGMAVFR